MRCWERALAELSRSKRYRLAVARVARDLQRDGDFGAAAYAGDELIDRVESLARLEPPRNAIEVHDRMVRALSAFAQSLVTRRGRGDPRPTLRRVREAREGLAPIQSPGNPA